MFLYFFGTTALQQAIWGHGRYDLDFVKIDRVLL